jgi:hypothetical protein
MLWCRPEQVTFEAFSHSSLDSAANLLLCDPVASTRAPGGGTFTQAHNLRFKLVVTFFSVDLLLHRRNSGGCSSKQANLPAQMRARATSKVHRHRIVRNALV